MGPQNLHKSRSHPKIRGSKKVTWSEFYSKDLQMLGATVKNSDARASRRQQFLHLYSRAPLRCHVESGQWLLVEVFISFIG